MSYELISFDLDGTLLNSDNEISPATQQAIARAAQQGKEVIFCTGRCVPELTKYCELLPMVRYLVCVSGSMVYDLQEKKTIYANAIPVELVRNMLDIADTEDTLVHVLTDVSVVEREKERCMADYTVGIYQELFDEVATKVDSVRGWFEANTHPIEKINLCFRDHEVRDRAWAKLSGYPLEIAEGEGTMLECTVSGVTKGNALKGLCTHLGLETSQIIAVGDAGNDESALQTAGLGIAVANATPEILAIADVVVADHDHDGCAEAIERYLLG